MSEALQTLERVRKQAVEHARAALARARAEGEREREAHRALAAESTRLEQALLAARASFVAATDVRTLRAASLLIETLEAERALLASRLAAAQARCHQAGGRLRACEASLREAEVSRRALAGRLAQKAAVVSARTARRLEDESDDAYRVQAHAARVRETASTNR